MRILPTDPAANLDAEIPRRRFLSLSCALAAGVSADATHGVPWETDAPQWLGVVTNRAALLLEANSYSAGHAHFDRALAFLETAASRERTPSVVVGLHGSGIAHALGPAVWDSWRLTDELRLPADEAQRNAAAMSQWLRDVATRLAGRVVTLVCDRTVERWAERARSAGSPMTLEQVRRELLPGIVRTPAMVTAAAAAQHRGAAYFVSLP